MNTLELMLPNAPQHWRDRVAAYDPMLAARATPNDATEAARHDAIRMLWNTYRARRVWLDRGRSGEERDDAGALIRLAAAGSPDSYVDELRESLTASEPTLRANALTVIANVIDKAELADYVRRAITDPDSVVRRQAALAAWQNEFADLWSDLAHQAVQDTDQLAAQTLIDFALTLAPIDEAIGLADRSPSHLQERAWQELARRQPRSALIAELAGPPFRSTLFTVLVSDLNQRDRDTWTSQDVADLATVLASQGDESELNHRSGVDAILARHPLAALTGRLTRPPGEYFEFHVGPLIAALSDEELARLKDMLTDPTTLLSHAGVTSTVPIDSAAATSARDYVASIATARTAPWRPQTRSRPATTHSERIDDALAARDIDRLITMPPEDVAAQLDSDLSSEVEARTTEELSRLVQSGRLNEMARTKSISQFEYQILEWAAGLHLTIDSDDWLPIALFALAWHDEDLQHWCRGNYPDGNLASFLTALADLHPDDATHALTVVPGPPPAALVERILNILASGGVSESRARATIAELIGADAGDDVRAWTPDPAPPWLTSVRVELGDCAAEATMLRRLEHDPSILSRWPTRYEQRWLEHVGCAESADLVQAAARTALIAGRETNDVTPVFAALERVSGNDVLRRYDELIANPEIPAASFLYYQRKAALNTLIETHAQRLLHGADLIDQVCHLGR